MNDQDIMNELVKSGLCGHVFMKNKDRYCLICSYFIPDPEKTPCEGLVEHHNRQRFRAIIQFAKDWKDEPADLWTSWVKQRKEYGLPVEWPPEKQEG